jgi:hypothetical protein
MLKPETILALLDEVAAAKERARLAHPDLNIGERLDLHRGADHAAANRFDMIAQAYRELLAQVNELTPWAMFYRDGKTIGEILAANEQDWRSVSPILRSISRQIPSQTPIFQHYKGGQYRLLGIGKEEATGNEVAIYQSEDGEHPWTRPVEEFAPPRFVPA